MATSIAIANQKGGVGKTMLCLNAAGALVDDGHRVLVVDMDQQGNLSSVFVKNIYSLERTIADVLMDGVAAADVICSTDVPRLDVLPANLDLSQLDARVAGDEDSQYYLLEQLRTVSSTYDYVLIDCPPSLGKATRMALVASECVVVPIECQDWAFKGAQQILNFIEKVRGRANPGLVFLGFVINKYVAQRRVEQDYYAALKSQYAHSVFQTEFRNLAVYAEAAAARQPITRYKPRSEQADAFRQFAKELVSYVQEKLHHAS